MAYDHGVYVREQDTSLNTPIEATAGLQVIFGTAPVNMGSDPYKMANKPVLCNTFAEAVSAMGYSDEFRKYTLCQSIDACFRVFNVAPIILINVLDPNKSEHIRKVPEDFLKFSKGTAVIKEAEYKYVITEDTVYRNDKFYFSKDDGDTYTALTGYEVGKSVPSNTYERVVSSDKKAFGILIDKVVVKSVDGATTYVEGTDYMLSFDSDGYVIVTVLSKGALKADDTVRVSYTALNPEGVTHDDIIGGIDFSNGDVMGLECISKVFPMFGLTPGLILAPGWADDPNVIAAIEAKCTNINGCFSSNCVLDISSNAEKASQSTPTAALKYSDLKVVKENVGIDSKMSFSCWPYGKIGDKIYSLSALVAARLASTDGENGDVPYVSPSNKSLGITGICLEDGTEVVLDQEQANIVNGYGIITAINMNGYKCWGNNTAAYPSTTDPKDRWVSVRRMFTWWGNSLILSYFQKVDDPMNYKLIESIVDSENIRGNNFVARGICATAKCEYFPDENPVTSLLDGKITFHITFTPYTPAEKIHFVLEFDPYALQSALEGGNS